MSFFVRAKYGFRSEDASLLRFDAGAIIEVLGQLESGWWDGLLGGHTRGWFPSNYVELASDTASESIDHVSLEQNTAKIVISQPLLSASTAARAMGVPSGSADAEELAKWVDAIMKELDQLVALATLSFSVSLSVTEKMTLSRSFARLTRSIVNAIHTRLLSERRLFHHRCSSSMDVAQQADDLAKLLIVRMRDLTKVLFEICPAVSSQSAYMEQQKAVKSCALQLASTLGVWAFGHGKGLSSAMPTHPTMKRSSAPAAAHDNRCDLLSTSPLHPNTNAKVEGAESQPHVLLENGNETGSPWHLDGSKRFSSSEAVNSVPRYLASDVAPGDLVLTSQGQIKGAPLRVLITQLTRHDMTDPLFENTFLMTYRSFTTSQEFVQHVVNRYHLAAPAGLRGVQKDEWIRAKRDVVRARAVNILWTWMEMHFFHTPDDIQALDMVDKFVAENMTGAHCAQVRDKLLTSVKRCRESGSRFTRPLSNKGLTEPIVATIAKPMHILEVHPAELARQLTLMEADLFSRIRTVDCLGRVWTKVDPSGSGSSVMDVISCHNHVVSFVAETILSTKKRALRTAILEYLITVADHCYKLQNYSSMWAIVSALNSEPIYRLQRTWDLLCPRARDKLAKLQDIATPLRNFAAYRQQLRRTEPPCIPFFGLYTKDLTFIEDGNPDFLNDRDGYINFGKCRLLSTVLAEIQRFQSQVYCLEHVPPVATLLKSKLQTSLSDEELYQMSLQLEPSLDTALPLSTRKDHCNDISLSHHRLSQALQENGFL